jgi:PKD repeat protein
MDYNRFLRIISSLEIFLIVVIFVGCSSGGVGSGDHSFSVSITSPSSDVIINEGESVNFQATASGGTSPYTFKWTYVSDWGSGGSATASIDEEDPGEMIFDKAGIYTFNLTVTDSTGALVSEAARVTVQSR